MKSKVLPIIISNVAVAAIVWVIASAGNDDSSLAAKDAEIQMLKDELAKKQPARQLSRNNRSRAVGEAGTPAAENADMQKQMEQRRSDMRQRRAQFQQMRSNATISRLALRLKLTDEQKAQLSGLSEKRSQLDSQMDALAESMRNARQNGTDTSSIEAQMRDLREQMRGLDPENYVAGLLTDEQKSQYDAYQQERATNRAETQATLSLSMIQEAVPMSQEQKNKYFSAYAAAALNSESGSVGIEETKNILKGVLSNEEYSAVEEQLNVFGRAFGGGRGGMRGGPGSGEPPPQP